MAEDYELCERFSCHKHKLVFFLSAMRHYSQALKATQRDLDYFELNEATQKLSFEEKLQRWIKAHKISELVHFEIPDLFFKQRIEEFCLSEGIVQTVLPSPMFLEESHTLVQWMKRNKRPFMKNYYEDRRQKTGLLMEQVKGKSVPVGGQFSFDEDNRRALPKDKTPPQVTVLKADSITLDVAHLVNTMFAAHPGTTENFWLPVTSAEAQAWLGEFLRLRFREFGDYEDALSPASPFLYHSVLSPFLNCGLLTPLEVLQTAEIAAAKNAVPLNSLEGFVRQILGWREFVRGVHLAFEKEQRTRNFFGHKRQLAPCWWNGSTGLVHLDRAIQKCVTWGYCHHIERLMVIGNVMLLCEVEPSAAHAWFMQMFVDSADWVMGPNVYGMALWSDGGIFATKPYICGSNYWLKMSGEKKAPWCDDLDALYWSFVSRQQKILLKNPRMSMMAKTFEKMDEQRKHFLLTRAEEVKERLTRI